MIVDRLDKLDKLDSLDIFKQLESISRKKQPQHTNCGFAAYKHTILRGVQNVRIRRRPSAVALVIRTFLENASRAPGLDPSGLEPLVWKTKHTNESETL